MTNEELEFGRISCIRQLCQTALQVKNWPAARSFAQSCEDSHERERLLSIIGTIIASAGHLSQAWSIADELEGLSFKCVVLKGIAHTLQASQCESEAEEVWLEAEKLIASIGDDEMRAIELTWLARPLYEAGHGAWAQRLCEDAERIAMTILDSKQRSHALSKIVDILTIVKQWDWTQKIVAAIKDEEERNRSLEVLSLALFHEGQRKMAETMVKSISRVYSRSCVLKDMVEILASEHDWTGAEKIARSIEEMDEQNEALCIIVSYLSEDKQWNYAVAIGATIRDEEERSLAYQLLVALAKESQDMIRSTFIVARYYGVEQMLKDSIELFLPGKLLLLEGDH